MDSTDSVEETIVFGPQVRNFVLKSGTGWLLILVSAITLGAALVIILPFLAYLWLRYRTTRYELTRTRLFYRTGIIFRREDEIELYRVKDIKVDFSIIQQMFNCGDLLLVSTDGTGYSNRQGAMQIKHVTQARNIREQLRIRVEKRRRRTGVREID